MTHILESIDHLTDDPILSGVYRYWNAKRAGRPMPERRDIDPIEIGPRFLPHVALFDVGDSGRRVRIRLMGTAIVARTQAELAGRNLDEVMGGPYRDFVMALYRDLYRHRAPVLSDNVLRGESGYTLRTRRVLMPLSNADGTVAMVFLAQTFDFDHPTPPPLTQMTAAASLETLVRAVLLAPSA